MQGKRPLMESKIACMLMNTKHSIISDNRALPIQKLSQWRSMQHQLPSLGVLADRCKCQTFGLHGVGNGSAAHCRDCDVMFSQIGQTDGHRILSKCFSFINACMHVVSSVEGLLIHHNIARTILIPRCLVPGPGPKQSSAVCNGIIFGAA